MSIGVSGMGSSELLLGRPFGGCTIFYRRSLLSHFTRVDSLLNVFALSCYMIIVAPLLY